MFGFGDKALIDAELQPHVLQGDVERIAENLRAALRLSEQRRGVGKHQLFELEPIRVLAKTLVRGLEEAALFVIELAEVDEIGRASCRERV